MSDHCDAEKQAEHRKGKPCNEPRMNDVISVNNGYEKNEKPVTYQDDV
jgi:hypothetical protein